MKAKLLFFYLIISLSIYAQVPTAGLNKEFLFTGGSLQNTGNTGGSLIATGNARTSVPDFLGQANNALSLNGDFLDGGVRGSSHIDSGNVTISFWIKTNTINSTSQNIIQQHNFLVPTNPIFGAHGWIVELADGKIKLTSNFHRAGHVNNTSVVRVFESNVIADNNWHHITIVLKKEAVYYNARWTFGVHRYIYVDNELQADGVDGGGPSEIFTRVSPYNSRVLIANGTNKYLGIIDNIRVYDRALEENDRKSLYTEFYSQLSALHVDKTATGDGTAGTWANALTDLKKAIEVASPQQEIWVKAGVYTPHDTDNTVSFNISSNDVKIYGGFAGNETTLNEREISLIHTINKTILSGDLQGNDDSNITFNNATRTDNSLRVVNIAAHNVVIDGVTISGGNANATTGEGRFGAGLSLGTVGDFTIKNSEIKNNVAWWAAGLNLASKGSTSTIVVENCIIKNNLTSGGGAAFYVNPPVNGVVNFTLVNNLIENNTTSDNGTRKGAGGAGGWIRAWNPSIVNPTVVNNTFVNNTNEGTATSDYPTLAMSRRVGNFITVSFANNIFWNNTKNNGQTAIAIGKVNDINPANNVTINNSIDQDNFSNINSSLKVNTSNSDPLFTDLTNNDFTLLATSPAVDSGDNSKIPSGIILDLFGNSRIYNTTVDMGAQEYYFSRKLTVNTSGGSVTTNPSIFNNLYQDGTNVTLTAVPDAGYQFDGWSNDASGATVSVSITMDADKTVTAMFSKIQRSLTINETNGTVSTNPNPTNGTYDHGTSVTLTATPATGYQFDGWSDDATGMTNPLTITMDGDKTVTAIFSKIQRTLTINAVGGTVSANLNPTNGTYDDGTSVTLTATPATGYQFDGWGNDANGTTASVSITMDADKTVTAMFSKIQRTLTINATNGTVSTNPNPTNGTYDHGINVTLTATPATGYQFDGWSGDAAGTINPLTITMDADKTVTAIFSKIQRTLTINATNGTVSTNPNSTNGTYDNGTSVTLTATPATGYQFDGWSGDAAGTTNPLTITMDADKTVTAIFSKIQRTLTINATNGTVSTNPNSTNGTYDNGTSVTLTATPASGYQFDGWSGDATGTTNPLTITMDADKTVTAIFSKIQRTLTINATNGTVSTNPNSTNGTYDNGTSVTLTATPAIGYQFDGWSGDAAGTTNPLTITMDADKTVTAIFSKIQRTLTINATNGTVSTNPNSTNGTYDDGTSVTLTANPDTGYEFDRWDGDVTGTNVSVSITMDADKTVTALFKKIQRTLTIFRGNGLVITNPDPTNGTYDNGTNVILRALPDLGYQFDGWSGDVSGTTNPITITMDSDKTVTAMFSKIQRGLTINAANGVVTRNPSSANGMYDDGTSVTLTATPNAGYQFDSWSGDASGTTNPLTITMDVDKTIIANFSAVTASVVDEEFNTNIKIYPNPSKGIIHIDLKIGYELKKVIVYNILGKKILEQTTRTIDVSNLVNGMYMVKVTNTEGKVAQRKIIKQ